MWDHNHLNSGKLQENNVITNAEAIQKVFEQGAGYTDYVATGTSEQQQRWEPRVVERIR